MFKSYFKVGWRNLLRNKGYSLINIGGLALGMTVAILNALWIWDELSFNKHFTNYDRIAAIAETGTTPDGTWVGTTMTYPLGTELFDHYHQHFTRLARTSFPVNSILKQGETLISDDGFYADQAIADMLSLNISAVAKAGFSQTHSLLLSESLAKRLFGDADPLNKTIRLNNKSDVVVAGVYSDFPRNTSFYGVNFIAPWSLYLLENKWIEERALTNWRNHFIKIYAELPANADFENVTAQIKPALQFAPEDLEDAKSMNRQLQLYPMSRWHLYPYGRNGLDTSRLVMIRMVAAIGIFVLLLACINFMNLNTARSEKRAKEVGIRKTIGSLRIQLVGQFLSESFLVVLFSFVLALLMTSVALPYFNAVADKAIGMPWTNILFWLSGAAFILITGFLAGSYPAFYLSSFRPIKVLKGTFHASRFASLPRKVLVVVQFSISVILAIGTVVVYQQVQHTRNRPVGYEREGLIMVRKKSGDFYGKFDVLRTELKNTGVVEEVSESMGTVTETASGNNGWAWSGREPEWDKSFVTLAVSATHGQTARWQFIQGRDFSTEIASDSSGIVINEAAAKFMGLEHPVGEVITWTWWENKNRVMEYRVLGVIKDMVMDSPYDPVEPSVFYLKGLNGTPNWINIRLRNTVSASNALPQIGQVFRKIIPAVPFEYKFVDQDYALKFAEEERIGKLASVFAVLAIFISSIGLFGLASFVAERRTKEIGIRKVLGATVAHLWRMLSTEFVVLVVIACAVAVPLARYLMNNWLEKYSYRIEISIWTFLLTCIAALTIALLTVSFQAVKGAMANPVKSLRSE